MPESATRDFPLRSSGHGRQERFTLLVSSDLLAEYREVLGYERIRRRHGMSDDALNEVVRDYRGGGVLVESQESLSAILNDPDDDRVLECAVAGGAAYIVSGDPHLLQLGSYREIPIITPRVFMKLLVNNDEGS